MGLKLDETLLHVVVNYLNTGYGHFFLLYSFFYNKLLLFKTFISILYIWF